MSIEKGLSRTYEQRSKNSAPAEHLLRNPTVGPDGVPETYVTDPAKAEAMAEAADQYETRRVEIGKKLVNVLDVIDRIEPHKLYSPEEQLVNSQLRDEATFLKKGFEQATQDANGREAVAGNLYDEGKDPAEVAAADRLRRSTPQLSRTSYDHTERNVA